jgi:ATP-binding cassette subfamily B protein
MTATERAVPVALFAQLSKRELRVLERMRTSIPASPGTVVARQAYPCREFVIVIEGTALVSRDGHDIALLEPGQHFGEIAIVRAVANPVTIVACTEMTLDVMSVREFRSAYAVIPALRKHVDDEIDRRVATWLEPRPSVPAPEGVRSLLRAREDDYTLAS